MKIKSKEGMPIFRKDSEKVQEGLDVWKKELAEVNPINSGRKEYWDHISSSRSL